MRKEEIIQMVVIFEMQIEKGERDRRIWVIKGGERVLVDQGCQEK